MLLLGHVDKSQRLGPDSHDQMGLPAGLVEMEHVLRGHPVVQRRPVACLRDCGGCVVFRTGSGMGVIGAGASWREQDGSIVFLPAGEHVEIDVAWNAVDGTGIEAQCRGLVRGVQLNHDAGERRDRRGRSVPRVVPCPAVGVVDDDAVALATVEVVERILELTPAMAVRIGKQVEAEALGVGRPIALSLPDPGARLEEVIGRADVPGVPGELLRHAGLARARESAEHDDLGAGRGVRPACPADAAAVRGDAAGKLRRPRGHTDDVEGGKNRGIGDAADRAHAGAAAVVYTAVLACLVGVGEGPLVGAVAIACVGAGGHRDWPLHRERQPTFAWRAAARRRCVVGLGNVVDDRAVGSAELLRVELQLRAGFGSLGELPQLVDDLGRQRPERVNRLLGDLEADHPDQCQPLHLSRLNDMAAV